eukprot:8876410-Pyramimonas_sp.AAC.1
MYITRGAKEFSACEAQEKQSRVSKPAQVREDGTGPKRGRGAPIPREGSKTPSAAGGAVPP